VPIAVPDLQARMRWRGATGSGEHAACYRIVMFQTTSTKQTLQFDDIEFATLDTMRRIAEDGNIE
jgi:hypothetical protein